MREPIEYGLFGGIDEVSTLQNMAPLLARLARQRGILQILHGQYDRSCEHVDNQDDDIIKTQGCYLEALLLGEFPGRYGPHTDAVEQHEIAA